MRRLPFFLIFLAIPLQLFCQGNIIYLISAPRSMSTAFLRMMEARNDFTVFNEPSQPSFERQHFEEMASDWYLDESPKNFQEVKELIFKTAEISDVFIKEISYGVHDYILDDPAFMRNPQIQFAILVRDPHAIAISFYNKIKYVPAGYSDLIGTKKLFELYEVLKKESPNPIPIVFSEELATNPTETTHAFCNSLGIAFIEESLSWSSFEEKGYEKWNECKTSDSVKTWHDIALKSTHFTPLHTYEKDEDGNPTFTEIKNLEDREKVRQAYAENAIFYEYFLECK